MIPKDDKRTEYPSGALRSDQRGRGRYDLISPFALHRLAVQYEEGGIQKGERNWEQGFPISRAICSSIRHLLQQLAGDRSEDHLAASSWQNFCAMHFEAMIDRGELPATLNDVPLRGEVDFYVPEKQEASTAETTFTPGSGVAMHWDDWFAQEYDLSEIQSIVGSWAEKTYQRDGVGMANAAICTHLHREVIELSDSFSPEEAADCFLILLHFAHKNDFNLLAEALKKHKINTERKWATEPDAAGVYSHIDEESE